MCHSEGNEESEAIFGLLYHLYLKGRASKGGILGLLLFAVLLLESVFYL